MKRAVLLAALLLAGCGHKGALVRVTDDRAMPGETLRALKKAEGQASTRALIPPAQAAPVRVDDVSAKLDERKPDPFATAPETFAPPVEALPATPNPQPPR
jgi:predicted small lipoprotein YifL